VKLLLDTHALLWFLADDPRLSASAKTTIEDPARLLSRQFEPWRGVSLCCWAIKLP